MSDASGIPSFESVPTSADSKPAKTPTVTKRDVTAIIASFTPAEAPQPTAAEKERATRKAKLAGKIRALVVDLQNLGVDDGTPADAAAAFKALAVVEKKAYAAIDSLTDMKLGLAEPRAPRATKPQAVKGEQPDPVAEQVDGPASPEADEQYEPQGGETPEQMDSRLAAERAERGAPTRSGPSAAVAPSANAEEGF